MPARGAPGLVVGLCCWQSGGWLPVIKGIAHAVGVCASYHF